MYKELGELHQAVRCVREDKVPVVMDHCLSPERFQEGTNALAVRGLVGLVVLSLQTGDNPQREFFRMVGPPRLWLGN